MYQVSNLDQNKLLSKFWVDEVSNKRQAGFLQIIVFFPINQRNE